MYELTCLIILNFQKSIRTWAISKKSRISLSWLLLLKWLRVLKWVYWSALNDPFSGLSFRFCWIGVMLQYHLVWSIPVFSCGLVSMFSLSLNNLLKSLLFLQKIDIKVIDGLNWYRNIWNLFKVLLKSYF